MKLHDDAAWRRKMRLRFDYNNMLKGNIGEEKGFAIEAFQAMEPVMREAFEGFMEKCAVQRRVKEACAWTALPYNQEKIVAEIKASASDIRNNFENFVLLGIGGSALGPIAVQAALNHYYYNELPAEKRRGPRFYVIDNIDPDRMTQFFDIIDVEKTCFNVITKSGNTSETMSQFLIIKKLLDERLGAAYIKNVVATTGEFSGNLNELARAEGIKSFYVPEGVGGRFSELCPVGLLAAAVCGIDIDALLAGAAYMDTLCGAEPYKNPALVSAALSYMAMEDGKNISVMMPYADSLRYIADWYAQLWAESLGKKEDKQKQVVHSGQTPVKALGVTDQHSQVQLYAEGPFDKVITFIGVGRFSEAAPIPADFEEIRDVAFLGGHSLNELLDAERLATEYAVSKAGKLNRSILLPEVNAFTIGQLLYFFELETAYCGEMLRINAFNQPGVEEGKNAAYALLGRPGYEEKKRELENAPKKRQEYIL